MDRAIFVLFPRQKHYPIKENVLEYNIYYFGYSVLLMVKLFKTYLSLKSPVLALKNHMGAGLDGLYRSLPA